jgi:dihydroxy-acid dehydratase
MRWVLPSRDVIASSIECMVRAHRFDGMVLLGSCDKIVPGMLMAAARLDMPAVFVNAGPMQPACYQGKHYDGNIVAEAVGWKQCGEITENEFREIENIAEPGAGSCAMLGTANTMGCLAEAMGLALPGTAVIPAVHARRAQAAYKAGEAIVWLIYGGVTTRKIVTRAALVNAARVLMTIGGSTNGILHLQAICREAGWEEMTLAEFGKLSADTPQIASVYPASPYDMVDFYEAGGVPAVMKELDAYLSLGEMTVTGKSMAENLAAFDYSTRREVIRPAAEPFSPHGGVAVLTGNLAPQGAVVKPAAMPEHMMKFAGKAATFHSEQECVDAILAGLVSPETILVLRYEGPKGGPGMPEMFRPMKTLEGMGLSESCAIITDGRFSGSNRGCFVGHISPEAYEGGALALVEDGDEIIIDIPAGTLTLNVSGEEMKRRTEKWSPPEKYVPHGYLRTYRQLSKSAAQGAVVE